MTKTRYPRTNKINFSWILPCCNFSFQKKVFFQGGNFCFLKQHSWLDNWIDCLPLFAPLLCIFARLKEKLSLEKCADWWVVIFEFFVRHAFRTSSHFRVHFSAFTFSLLGLFCSSVSKSTPRVFMVKNLDDASKKILEQWMASAERGAIFDIHWLGYASLAPIFFYILRLISSVLSGSALIPLDSICYL